MYWLPPYAADPYAWLREYSASLGYPGGGLVPLLPVTPLGYRDPRWGRAYTRRWEELVSDLGWLRRMPVTTIPGLHPGGIALHLDPATLMGQIALQTGMGLPQRGYVGMTLMGIDPRLQGLYRRPRRRWRTYPGRMPLYQQRVRMRGPLHPMEHFLYSTVQMPGYLAWQEPFLLADALGRDYAQRVWYL